MNGSLHDQLTLAQALVDYESAEFCALLVNVRDQQRKADHLHDRLCVLAFHCGYAPGRQDRHLTVVQWARLRVLKLREMIPNNLREAGL